MAKILIVEDDSKIARFVELELRHEGYETETATDGRTGLAKALEPQTDLVLLDIMLPKMNGFEVCENIRYRSQVPIIFLTAREEQKDKILGLETGADDSVTKPFSFPELLLRIEANIRRASGEVVRARKGDAAPSRTITVGELEIDTEHYSIRKGGEELELSKKDYDFILFLAENLGNAYSREELLDAVAHPEKHENLVVRIGGYAEYFNRLSPVLKQTVIDRTEY